jgi:hypothetical protein
VPGFNLKSLFQLRRQWNQLWEYWVFLQSTSRRLRSFIDLNDIHCFAIKQITQFDILIFTIASKMLTLQVSCSKFHLIFVNICLHAKCRHVLYASKCMVPAPNATSALLITTRCVHRKLVIAWRLNTSQFVFDIFLWKIVCSFFFIILTSAKP